MVIPIVPTAVAARTFLLRWLRLLPVVVTRMAVLATTRGVAASLLFRLGLVCAMGAVLVTAAVLVLLGFVVLVTVAG